MNRLSFLAVVGLAGVCSAAGALADPPPPAASRPIQPYERAPPPIQPRAAPQVDSAADERRARALGDCLDAADLSACLLRELPRLSPASDQAVAVLTGVAADRPPEAAPRLPAVWLAARAIARDRHGAAPDAALAEIDALPATTARLEALQTVCGDRPPDVVWNAAPRYAVWDRSRLAPPELVRAALARVERVAAPLGPYDPDKPLAAMVAEHALRSAVQDALHACRLVAGDPDAAVGDEVETAWSRRERRTLTALAAGRFEAALAEARAASAAEVMPAAPPPPAPFVWPGAFSAAQGLRARVLIVADAAGRDDIAAAAAGDILRAALAPERPPLGASDASRVARALAWMAAHRAGDLSDWVERLDAAVRPGRPAWKPEDAVAVHAAWLALGRADRAEAYRQAVLAAPAWVPRAGPAASPLSYPFEPRQVEVTAAVMAARAGRAEVAPPPGAAIAWWPLMVNADLEAGAADQSFLDRLSRADDMNRMLGGYLCIQPTDPWAPTLRSDWPAPSLEVQAACARQLTEGGERWGRTMMLQAAEVMALDFAIGAMRHDRPDLAMAQVREYLASRRGEHPRPVSENGLAMLAHIAAADLATRTEGSGR